MDGYLISSRSYLTDYSVLLLHVQCSYRDNRGQSFFMLRLSLLVLGELDAIHDFQTRS